MTQTDRGRTPAPCGLCQSTGERNSARAMMTPKERLKVHAEIERQNREKLEAWKRKQKKGGKSA